MLYLQTIFTFSLFFLQQFIIIEMKGLSNTLQAPARQHTSQPIVTGTSVLAIKYADGVMLAADTLASYGSLARYKDVQRIQKIGNSTIIGASGEISDFQSIIELLEDMHQDDINQDDGYQHTPREYFEYLRAVLYQRRNKFNPLWNQVLVAGFQNDQPFLGYVDLIGTAYQEDFIATGFGAYLAIPLIRERWSKDMSEGEARALLEDCMRVCYYRDCRAFNRIQLGKVTADGGIVSAPYYITSEWETANYDARHNPRSSVGSSAILDGSSW
jgi:20S proteasome subunit beta 7